MKIEYRKGDLFQTELSYIVHGCNAQGVMGSGVAKIVREQYPEAYAEYVRMHKSEGGLELGDVIWAESRGKWIGNAITQQFYGGSQSIRHAGKVLVVYIPHCECGVLSSILRPSTK